MLQYKDVYFYFKFNLNITAIYVQILRYNNLINEVIDNCRLVKKLSGISLCIVEEIIREVRKNSIFQTL